MSIILSDDQIAVRDGARRFSEANFGPAQARRRRDIPSGRDASAQRKVAADGWMSILVSPEDGGSGQGLQEACLVAEAFGRELAPFSTATIMALLPVLAQCPEGSGRDAFQSMLDGSHQVGFAFSDATRSLKTRRQDSGLVLTGEVRRIHDVAAADHFLLEIDNDQDHLLVLLSASLNGLSVDAQRTADGGSIGRLIMKDCIVPSSDVFTKSNTLAAELEIARLRLPVLAAAELLGIMDVAICRTVEHLKTRQQFGKTLGSFQALQFRMADAHLSSSLTRSLVYEAARLADAGASSAALLSSVALAKAAEAAIFATRTFIQMMGAMGFTDEHDAGLFLKRVMVLSTAFGTALEHRHKIAGISLVQGAKDIEFREDSTEDRAFRAEVRQWLDGNLPQRLRHLPTRPSFEDAGFWHRKLFERGWVAPNWPKQFGGMEASVAQQIILAEELGRVGAPEISGQAIGHLGPILQVFGTDAQKAQHLPKMLSGEMIWCQGYSEPSSGSDLASLRTRAVVNGDDLVINGSKIWTTWAHHADWMFCLVRTNPDVKKQEGLTFVLVDMRTKGITPRAIRTITGEDEFAEVFLDDVHVPISNVVGKIDGGWKVATALLEKERLNGANPQKCSNLLAKVKSAAHHSGMMEDPAFRDRLVRAEIDYIALCATYAQIVKITETDMRTNADFAYAKLVAAELLQELCELMMLAMGAEAASIEAQDIGGGVVNSGLTYLQSRRATIYGGTVEIQRMLMARRVLGLV